MSRKNTKKIPKTLVLPSENKIPKVSISLTEDRCRPEFRADQIDKGGPWGWNKFDPIEIQIVFQKIFEAQKLTWTTLRENGSHLVDIQQLCSEARKRLSELEKDDLDQLYSLRLTGIKRIWGIKEGNILWILWWDPIHTACPTKKKHT